MRSLSLKIFRNEELIFFLIASLVIAAAVFGVYLFLEKKRNKPGRKTPYILAVIVMIYTLISFTDLGSSKMPVTTWQPSVSPQTITLELPERTFFTRMILFYGEGDNNSNPTDYQLGFHHLLISGSMDGILWDQITMLNSGSIYRYTPVRGTFNYRFIRIISQSPNDSLSEIAFADDYVGDLLKVRVYEDEGQNSLYPADLLIDEQDLVEMDPTYYDESYFDEIYHPRNAWEIAEQQYMYATVHPLLGTELITLSIKLLGNSPLAWRLPGAILGSAMLFLMYWLAKEITHSSRTALAATFLFACDFMHITTSRIGTLEPMSIFSILLMFCIMLHYANQSFYEVPFRRTLLILLACGISMGLAISTKWTACYSAVGLAIILFFTLYQRGREFLDWKKNRREIEPDAVYRKFPEYFLWTILSCFLFFIIIPVVIYFVVYMPAHITRNGWSVQNVINHTLSIYRYHVNLTATHPFQSVWYQWILDIRPIWYYEHFDMTGKYYTISCFTNPVLCMAGIFAILYAGYEAVRKKSTAAFYIVTGYVTALAPWFLVERCIFAYHFYPTSLFMIIAIAFSLQQLRTDSELVRKAEPVFLAVVLIVFIIYLPITCGFATTAKYANALELLKSWIFA